MRVRHTVTPSHGAGPVTMLARYGIATTLRGLGQDTGTYDPNTADFVIDSNGDVYGIDASGNAVFDQTLTDAAAQAAQSSGSAAVQAAASSTSSMSDFANLIIKLLPTVMQANAQNKLINTNLTRAQQGLPPLSLQSVTPGLNFGLTPGTQSGLMTIALIGIGAFALTSLLRRR